MDKVALIIKEGVPSIRSLSRTTLSSELNITVSQEDLECNNVLAFIDSCEFTVGVLNAKDDKISDLTVKIVAAMPRITINHTGVQGGQLLKLLLAVKPEKEGQLRRALMLKRDMLEVLSE